MKYPLGIQDFAYIRNNGFVYVDKTFYVHKLADEGKFYFLSRPRRFGKSLFLSTLYYAFSGRKELFQGLYLEKNWDWEKKYPIVRISFGSGVIRSVEDLKQITTITLEQNAEEHNVNPRILTLGTLVRTISNKTNSPVVLLIDEYDKPILDVIDKPELLPDVRDTLRNFYAPIKDLDPYLRFVFITGISKFSKVSIFSELNNLQDITLHKNYGDICGYTQEEVERYFYEVLKQTDKELLKKWYNGYYFLGDKLYNPYDVMSYFDVGIFRPYWFETGTPTFLVKLLKEQNIYIPRIEEIRASDDILFGLDIYNIPYTTLLFQTGYLTIKKVLEMPFGATYLLGFPNLEVKISFNDFLMKYLFPPSVPRNTYRQALGEAILEGNLEGAILQFKSLFAGIPYHWYVKNEITKYEGYWSSLFYTVLSSLGFDTILEDTTSYGRIDMTLLRPDYTAIFEFKLGGKVEEALAQLKEKRYWEKYEHSKPVYLIGIIFDEEQRNIVEYRIEELQ